MFTIICLGLAYLVVAVAAFLWLAPPLDRMREDHLTSALLALLWPVVLIWLVLVCLCEIAAEPEED